jgi:hypothetical protein
MPAPKPATLPEASRVVADADRRSVEPSPLAQVLLIFARRGRELRTSAAATRADEGTPNPNGPTDES